MLHRNVPLAQQVANEVLSQIVAGTLGRSEGLLPSEAELSERFRVSRATVRDALSRLEQRGVIIRRHGIGTFVASSHPLMEAGLEELESVFTLAKRIGLEPFNGSILDLFLKRSYPPLKHSYTELTAEPADATIAAKLQLRRGDTLFKVEAQLYAQDGCVVDSSLSYFVPGYLRFHVIRRVRQVGV
jgi:DNA-binding GntR family transcriptional regulator